MFEEMDEPVSLLFVVRYRDAGFQDSKIAVFNKAENVLFVLLVSLDLLTSFCSLIAAKQQINVHGVSIEDSGNKLPLSCLFQARPLPIAKRFDIMCNPVGNKCLPINLPLTATSRMLTLKQEALYKSCTT